MEFFGLSVAQFLGLLGAAGGAVTALYLLRMRRRRVFVPFVHLWDAVLAQRQRTRLWSRLRRLFSYLLAMAIVLLLLFAVADPRPSLQSREATSTVVLVDAGRSMQATDVQPDRLEAAKEQARLLIEDMGPSDLLLIAQMDSSTHAVTPMTNDARVLLEGLGQIHAVDVDTELAPALRLSVDVLRDRAHPRIVIISDGVLRRDAQAERKLLDGDTEVAFIPVGRRGRNVAVSALAARRYRTDKSKSELLVELHNTSSDEERVELTLLSDGEAVDVVPLELAPGQRARRIYDDLSAIHRTVEARIRLADGSPDDLPADDRAFAQLPARRRSKVLCVTEGNLYLQAALLLDEYLDVDTVSESEYAPGMDYDVVIFDNVVPEHAPRRPAIYLHPLPTRDRSGPLPVRGTLERPSFDRIDRDHPVTRWLALRDVNVAEALVVEPRAGDQVIAGDRRAPLLVAGQRNELPFVALTFDVRQSDLPLRVAWPVLLLNSIDWLTGEHTEDAHLSSHFAGEPLELQGDEDLTLTAPDGTTLPVAPSGGRATISPKHTGFYRVRSGGEPERLVALNLQPDARHDIEPEGTLTLGGRQAEVLAPTPTRSHQHLWIYLLLVALAVLALEWLGYHRRWTV